MLTLGGGFTAGALGAVLLDGRGWEMVSPVDKNGGGVGAPGSIYGGGVLQAAADGNSITFSSSASFGAGAAGAPPGSQYIATRGAGSWSTANISAASLSGGYGIEPEGVPYQLFSGDLARGLLLDPRRCGDACPRSYSLREGGGFSVLYEALGLRFAGADPDLRHIALVAAGGLYEWSGGQLDLVSAAPAAELAAQSGAVSDDGSRVYFTTGSNLYLREGGQTKQVDEAVAGGGTFQTASSDGSIAFYTKAGHLYRYESAGTGSSTDLTPSGGVAGVLGASAGGDYVYYQDGAALKLWHGGATTTVAPGAGVADAGDYPPTAGTARVSADGTRLLFVSTESPTGYDNADAGSGEPDSEVYLYDAGGPGLACVSCDPTGERPSGPSTIPGAIADGAGPEATDSYKPRVLVDGGRRVFFDSTDALAPGDSNQAADAYEWEAEGEGSCAHAGGCIGLISSGRAAGSEGSTVFADASADGADAFFLTPRSLVGTDPGSVDLYDAREGGGFPEPLEPIPCKGDNCQVLPPEPQETTLTTLISGPGNPKVRYRKPHRRKRHHHVRRSSGGAK